MSSSLGHGRRAAGLVALLTITAFTESSDQGLAPSAAQQEARESLGRPGDWYVRWDEETKSPATIEERRPSIGAFRRSRRPESAAASFVHEHAGLFPLRPGRDSLLIVQVQTRPRRARLGNDLTYKVRMTQLYQGVAVDWGGYTMNLSADGRVLFMNGRFVGGIEVDPVPTIRPETCERIARGEVGAGADSVQRPTRLVVKRYDGRDHLVWAVTVPEDGAHLWVVEVDAHDGHVVTRGNRVMTDPR